MAKLYFIFLFTVLFSGSALGQGNKIKVKKKEPPKKEKSVSGFYYSHAVQIETKGNGGINRRIMHYYIYLDNMSNSYLFVSKHNPEKAYQKFMKNPDKYIQEQGRFNKESNDLYLEMSPILSNSVYRYVGNVYDNEIYLYYKAAYKKKVVLDLKMYRYAK